MGSISASDYDELSEYSYAESDVTASMDTVDELLQRFTLDCHPDCTIKLRNKAGPVVVGADLTYSSVNGTSSGTLVVKPVNASAPWRRLKVDHSGTFTLRSRKLSWWVFTLDLHGHANPFKRTTDMSFRVATKWDISTGEIRKKRLLPMGENAEGRVHWNVNYSMPTIEGSLGTQQARDIHADLGYAHFSIPKVELVVWPSKRPSAESANLDEDEAPSSSSSSRAAADKGGSGAASPKQGSGGGFGSVQLASLGVAATRALPWLGAGSSGWCGGKVTLGGIRLDSRDLKAHVFQLCSRAGECGDA